MKKGALFFVFLVINFTALAIGSWLMNNGPESSWYLNLNKAPWTPPGWLFGVAWTTIMLCFSWYLAELFYLRASKVIVGVYSLQVLLNVSWNWVFFDLHKTGLALIIICFLTLVIAYFFITFRNERLKYAKYLLLPYLIWLVIASSLNAYVVLYN